MLTVIFVLTCVAAFCAATVWTVRLALTASDDDILNRIAELEARIDTMDADLAVISGRTVGGPVQRVYRVRKICKEN